MQRWLVGYFGHSNLGDDLLMLGALKLLGRSNTVVLSDDPRATRRVDPTLKVSLLPPISQSLANYSRRYRAYYWVRHGVGLWPGVMGRSRCFYACAGAINDHVPGRLESLLDRVQALKRLTGHVAIIGAGVSSVRSEADHAVVRKLVDVVDYLSVRDIDSAKQLLGMGVSNDLFHIGADLSFAFAGYKPQNPSLDKFHRVAVNLRPLFDKPLERGQKGQYVQEYREFSTRLIEWLDRQGYEVTLLPFSPEDEVFLNQVGKNKVSLISKFDPRPHEMLKKISEFDVVIGMRYHAVIMSLLTGTPVIPIPYSHKVINIARATGMYSSKLCIGDGGELPPAIPDLTEISNELRRWAEELESRKAELESYCLTQRNALSTDISRVGCRSDIF